MEGEKQLLGTSIRANLEKGYGSSTCNALKKYDIDGVSVLLYFKGDPSILSKRSFRQRRKRTLQKSLSTSPEGKKGKGNERTHLPGKRALEGKG